MVDFINEVEEELRKDKYNQLLRKFGPYLVMMIIGVVVVTGYLEYRNAAVDKHARAASASFVAAARTMEAGNTQKAIDQFLALADVAPKGYAGRSLDIVAGLELERGNKEIAITHYDKAAATYSEPIHKDLSAYKAALVVMEIGRFDDAKARAKALQYDDAPYSDLAKELFAQAELKTGDVDTAKIQFSVLSNLPGVQNGVKIRSGQALALLKTQTEIDTSEETADTTPETLELESEIEAPEPIQAETQKE